MIEIGICILCERETFVLRDCCNHCNWLLADVEFWVAMHGIAARIHRNLYTTTRELEEKAIAARHHTLTLKRKDWL